MPLLARLIARWRFKRATRKIDRQIAEARRLHQPVRYLLERKKGMVHAWLGVGR